jgi:hypothetical protein
MNGIAHGVLRIVHGKQRHEIRNTKYGVWRNHRSANVVIVMVWLCSSQRALGVKGEISP